MTLEYSVGGYDGFIPGAMKVYPVKKQDANQDYHDNVDAATYTRWFTNLLDILDKKGPHIIVSNCD